MIRYIYEVCMDQSHPENTSTKGLNWREKRVCV
jgi:hypothetical protein